MNRPLPNPSSFTFLSSTPNSTPTPNFFYPRLQDPPPPPPPPPPQSVDLPSTLSTLKDLIDLSETTIGSFSTLLRTATCSSSSGFCPCPFNPHHRVPPESLFRHSLQCPSSSAIIDLTIVESLHYPNTLQSSEELVKQSRFVRTLHDSDAELCFSLDDYGDFGSNFFYRDCSAVVSVNDQDNPKRTFTLPGILSAECANFIGSGDCEIKGFSRVCLRLLPSELWFVRSEIEAWNDFPTTYSYRVLRAILCLPVTKESDFLKWVIVNSPRYGIVIDVSMRDHMFLLLRLGLKAITREAVGSADLVFKRKVNELNLTTMSFKCPVLVEVLKWLSFQLSVLYGEVNGKFFAMNMLKQCLLNASSESSLFPAVQKANESPAFKEVDGKPEEPLQRSIENEKSVTEGEIINSRVIFVSQVAAAIAALHERSLLEEKIKAFRNAQSLSNYQRVAEYAYLSKRADEERLKRSNYRPIIEHDGLLWQRSYNEEANKMKTREELLAEERDYKRRRMSYRGKKLKRTTTQVMRDIIEEYTEEIKQAGGIGCLLKGAEEAGTSASPADDVSTGHELKRSVSNSYEGRKGWAQGDRKQLNSQYDIRFKEFEDDSSEAHKQKHRRQDSEQCHEHNKTERSVSRDRHHSEYHSRSTDGNRRQDSLWHRNNLETERSFSRDRGHKEYYSRSPDRRRSDGRLHGYISNRVQNDNADVSRKYLHHGPDRNHSRSHERTGHQRDRIDQKSDVKTRQGRSTYRNYRSESVIHHDFEDRYDPSESHDMYGDDFSSGNKYIKP